MTVSAHDIVRQLRDMLPGAGDVKVQKLLYYCQGWHLAFTGEPMFPERIAAWDKGPVVADLWHAEDKGRPIPTPKPLGHSALGTIGYVVERYGTLTGNDLARLGHSEDPWIDADSSASGDTISHQAMADFFVADEDMAKVRALGDELLADPEARARMGQLPGAPDDPREIDRRLAELQSR